MEFVNIEMTKSRSGSPDGIQVHHYAEGETYEVPQSLANAFVKENVAKLVKAKEAPADKPEAKADEAPATKPEQAPSNKAEAKAPADKAAKQAASNKGSA